MTSRRIWAARGVAILADFIQLVLAPLFFEGGLSALDAILDLSTAGLLTWLVGWHWAFLPAFISEIIPGIDLIPSWTVAVFVATRHRSVPEDADHGRVIDVEAKKSSG